MYLGLKLCCNNCHVAISFQSFTVLKHVREITVRSDSEF